MSFEILTRQPIKFYEKNGIKVFDKFNAVDSFKNPLKVSFNPDETTIYAHDFKNTESAYTLNFNIPKREMEGVTLVADPPKKGIGEVLTLSALMEFVQNNLNYFKTFSLKESIQFHARFGFNLVTNDVDEILHHLKMVLKSRSPKFENLRYDANFYYPKLSGKVKNDDEFINSRACHVASKYLQELSKDRVKIDPSNFRYSSHMLFTDYETLTNKDYLNTLLDKHEINYKF